MVVILIGISIYPLKKQYEAYKFKQEEQRQQSITQSEAQQKALLEAQVEIEKLKLDNETSKKKEAQLEQAVKKSSTSPVNTLSSIIRNWRPRIAYVVCSYKYSLPSTTGSGLLMKGWIATNDHVIRYEKALAPTSCSISLPDRNATYYSYPSDMTVYGGGVDMAGVTISNQDEYTDSIGQKSVNYCKRKAEIGESIVILGYPYTGSSNDITATEGIISGYDGYYYVTSAKIEHGNSGGVAVLLKDNCYLGIPSSVAEGELESLGRILDARILNDASYFDNHPNGI